MRYAATTTAEIEPIAPLFAAAAFKGPFSDGARYFWREDVDEALDAMSATIAAEQFADFGDFNRKVIETALARPLATHECKRCGGTKGGFLCPFTQRTVCQRSDCSVSASSWIPSGAQLSR